MRTWLEPRLKPAWKQVRVHGPGFAVYAVVVNILDDIVLPLTLGLAGYPILGGLAFVGDLDWLTYPMYFIAIALWKGVQGSVV